MRHFHYYDMAGFGHNVTYDSDVKDMPHKSAHWSIEIQRNGDIVCYSYSTLVAIYDGANLHVRGWGYSATTSKHIRWFADYISDMEHMPRINTAMLKNVSGVNAGVIQRAYDEWKESYGAGYHNMTVDYAW